MKLPILFAVAIASNAHAGPILSSACEIAKEISAPENSGGYFMDKTCKRVYVLPPAKGEMEVNGRTVGDLTRCSEIKDFNKALKSVNVNINNAIKNRNDDKTLKGLFDQRKLIIDQYADLAATLGSSVELQFSNGIENNVQAFRDLNPGLDLEFVSVQVKDAKIQFNQKDTFDPQMNIAFNKSIPISDLNDIGPGSFGGRLDLSLVGACPLIDPFDKTIPVNLKARELSGLITPNMTYKYEVGATYTYKATYNLASLAKKIRELSTQGGLFKTSSTSTLIETAESAGWFSLDMSCDDSRVCDKLKIETALQIKQRLMKEVFDNISISTIGTVMNKEDAATPGKNGASQASDALKKCPNAYCQAAAVLLDVGSAVFGGTSKTDQYIKSNNFSSTDESKQVLPVEFTGVMGFGKKD